MRLSWIGVPAVVAAASLVIGARQAQERHPRGGTPEGPSQAAQAARHREAPDDRPAPQAEILRLRSTSPAKAWSRGGYQSIQVNVDAQGRNIVGDAANEPSLALDPTNPTRMAIGWRQFDTIANNFRQAGWAYTRDGGQTWTFPGVLRPGEFSSDPVLDYDAEGTFYFLSLQPERGPGEWACYMYRSTDGGMTWPVEKYAYGGDKEWFTIDRTNSIGRGHIYSSWNPYFGCCNGIFTRSVTGGETYLSPIGIPERPGFGTLTVGPDGELYVAGGRADAGLNTYAVVRSRNAKDSGQTPVFDQAVIVDLGGPMVFSTGPNPDGALSQVWIAADHSDGPTRGNVYLLCSVDPAGEDPLDVMFSRSTDGGLTWSPALRINDDAPNNGAWQWFGAMAVAPNGRIDAIWNDTRSDSSGLVSELYYTHSFDAGVTWSPNEPLSPPFNHHLGYPDQEKLGDYYDLESDNLGVSIAYAATFNGEQDVYYLRVGSMDCNHNGVPDAEDISGGTSVDCNGNDLPDECEPDCNGNGVADTCDVRDGTSPDCDGNRIPDECDPDFDGDGTVDGCDLDIDDDGVANEGDVCDYTPLGMPVDRLGRSVSDTNQNCVIDLLDAKSLIGCVTSGGPGVPLARGCTTPFDYDGDTDVDLANVAVFMNAFGR